MSHSALGRQFFHTTHADIEPGDTLKTYHEQHGPSEDYYVGDQEWRQHKVWMHDSPEQSPYTGHYRAKVYEVAPTHDVQLHVPRKHDDSWDTFPDEPEYRPQYHASSARVVRRVE